MPRAKRLTTAEAAARVGISESQMRVIAHRDGIGRKEGGAWSFTENEVKKLIAQRKARQRWERERRKLNGLPPKRKKPKRRAPARDPYDDEERPRRRRGGLRTIDDSLSQAGSPLAQLDALLARERALEQRYQLPFRGPLQTRYALIECPRCKQPAMLMIDCDNARDEAGIDGYERLCAGLIREHQLPTVLRLPISGPIDDPATRGVVRLRWWDGRPAELLTLDEDGWNALVERVLGEHCASVG